MRPSPAAPTATDGLLAALRAATGAAHARAEAAVDPLAAPDPRAAYLDYLARQHALLGVLEPALAPVRMALGLAPAPPRAQLAAADLAALGAPCAAPAPALGTAPGALPPAAGWLYVVEGQALGGRALLRALGPLLSVDAGHGGAFLAGEGEATVARFRAVSAALEAFDRARPQHRGAVVAGAVEAFERIAGYLAGGK